MHKNNLNIILEKHKLWLKTNGLEGEIANLSEADLSDANLSRANLSEANLSEANLSRADLYKADLFKANLSRANLSRANLSEANLSEANLYKADLFKANLSRANLSRADLFKIQNKNIITFQFNKHFTYYCDGNVKIGCEFDSLDNWLLKYKELGKSNNYSDLEIKMYGDLLKLIKKKETKL